MSAAVAFCLATAGCSAPSQEDSSDDLVSPPAEIEEALSLTVDGLDIRHGGLRIEATMLDGSADVSMWLGPTCDPHEVGRGIATRSGFVWSLEADDVGRAIECNLVVKAHAIDDDGTRVLRVAPLDVSVSLVPDGAELVRLVGQQTDGSETTMTFEAPSRAQRLHIGGSVIGAEPEEESEPNPDAAPAAPRHSSSFAVSNDDFARSILHRRRVSVLGEHFLATVSVGPLTLDVSEPKPEPETPAVEENAVDVAVEVTGDEG